MISMNKIFRPYATYFLAWLVMGVVFLGQNVGRRFYFGDSRPWQDIPYWAVSIAMFALLTPLMLWCGRRFPLDKSNWQRAALLHFMLGIGVGLLKALLATILYHWFPWLYVPGEVVEFKREFELQLIYGIHTSIIAYWMVIGMQIAYRNHVRYQERAKEALRLELGAAQLRAQITNARLTALKAQLQPHFLFNTLNAIMVLVRQQRGALAEATLESFGNLLRAVLEDIEAQEVPLSRELEYIKLYLTIEQLRFSDRLQVSISIDPEILDAAVPHMSLQPLVENAIRHGIEQRSTAGEIEIRAAREGDTLKVWVQDNGPGFITSSKCAGTGIGLANTRARISQLYGEAASLTCVNSTVGGAVVTMTLPYRNIAIGATR